MYGRLGLMHYGDDVFLFRQLVIIILAGFITLSKLKICGKAVLGLEREFCDRLVQKILATLAEVYIFSTVKPND